MWSSRAQDDAGEEKNWPPKAYPLARYEMAWSRNPFDLKTVPPPVAAVVPGESFAKNLVISGITEVGDTQTLYLFDKQASRYLRLTAEPNPDGLRLVELQHHPDIRKLVARIALGDQEAEVRFAELPTPGKRPQPPTRPDGKGADPSGRSGEESSGQGDGRN